MAKSLDSIRMTPQEREGVKAIMFLQDFAGIEEPELKALAGWRSMSPHEKRRTLQVWKTILDD